MLQDVLKEPVFGRSPQLWLDYIAWQKHQVLGGMRGLVTVLDIRSSYSEALKVR